MREKVMLLNIDILHRTATLHKEGCFHLPRSLGTKFKLVGQMGRDGGWFPVNSKADAVKIARQLAPKSEVVPCNDC
jgi:hypothetical protein